MAPADTGSMSNMDESTLNQFASHLTPQQIEQTQWNIENAGRVSMHDFKVSLGVLFGLAVLCFLGRISIRLYTRRRLFLDDGLLAFGFVCLIGGTAILYKRMHMIYLEFAVIRGDPIAALMAFQQMDDLFEQSKWQLAYLLFLWTAIFAVKWCYFAFFHSLLRPMAKGFIYYYWSAVAFSVVSWLFLVIGEQLITCPYVGKEAAKCFPELPASKAALLALFWVCPALDGLTDATIVVIPVFILRQSQMRLLTKIGIGVFLCLSIFMLACSIIRAAGTYYQDSLDFPWQVFWLHAEACIGITMGSITVYRSTLVGSNEVSDKLQSYLHRVFGRLTPRYTPGEDEGKTNDVQKADHLLVRIPRATLTGLRTVFGAGRTGRATEATFSTQDSEFGLIEADYHAHIKAQGGPPAAKACRDDTHSA